jgi:hypothetical protein
METANILDTRTNQQRRRSKKKNEALQKKLIVLQLVTSILHETLKLSLTNTIEMTCHCQRVQSQRQKGGKKEHKKKKTSTSTRPKSVHDFSNLL